MNWWDSLLAEVGEEGRAEYGGILHGMGAQLLHGRLEMGVLLLRGSSGVEGLLLHGRPGMGSQLLQGRLGMRALLFRGISGMEGPHHGSCSGEARAERHMLT